MLKKEVSYDTAKYNERSKNTVIPNDICYIDKLTISFFNSSNCGHDSRIEATGYMYKEGTAHRYMYDELDISILDFLNSNDKMIFIGMGDLHIIDELNYMDLKTPIYNFEHCKGIFPTINKNETISSTLLSSEYDELVRMVLIDEKRKSGI